MPSREPWEMCIDQKRRDERCICINVIFREGDRDAAALSHQIAGPIVATISGNIQRCCPAVRAEVHRCVISTENWKQVVAAIGSDQAVTSWEGEGNEFRNLFDTQAVRDCFRNQCINIVIVDINGGALGLTNTAGESVMSPDGLRTDTNLSAHEAGHALGLSHDSAGNDRRNMMHPTVIPSGTQLTREQCRTIFENINNFACR